MLLIRLSGDGPCDIESAFSIETRDTHLVISNMMPELVVRGRQMLYAELDRGWRRRRRQEQLVKAARDHSLIHDVACSGQNLPRPRQTVLAWCAHQPLGACYINVSPTTLHLVHHINTDYPTAVKGGQARLTGMCRSQVRE